jgi:sporulation protein YabP
LVTTSGSGQRAQDWKAHATKGGERTGGAGVENKLKVEEHHRVVLLDREQLELSGVQGVVNFDDQEIVVETNRGVLKITGSDLHIKHLDLEAGKMEVEGLLAALEYTQGPGAKGKGLLGRLFR